MSGFYLIESVSWIAVLLLEVPLGWFADRFGYRKTFVLANGFYFISKVIFFAARSFPAFLLERLVLSLALAGLSGCDAALLCASVPENERSKVFSRYHSAFLLGFALASLLTTVMIRSPLDAASVDRTGFWTMVPFLLAFLLSFFLREVPRPASVRPGMLAGIRAALRQPALIMLVVALALAREIYQTTAVFLNQAQYLRSGIAVTWFGFLLVVMQGIRLLAVKSYRLGECLGLERSIILLLALFPCASLILFFTHNPVLSIIGVMLVSAALSFLEPMAMASQNSRIADESRATILSVYAMIGEIVAAAVNPVIGWAADAAVDQAFLVCVILGAVGLTGYLLVARRAKKLAAIHDR